ncbi:MAG: fumarylacetoacetate hydrolase family protein [Saccharofermentanales bacterium]|jgi:2-keto-4-pentenoate hydratase/2-oxohepta-3-ene-1,7-dioic acid hydratase in catechol pathway
MKFLSYLYQDKACYGVMNADNLIFSMFDILEKINISSSKNDNLSIKSGSTSDAKAERELPQDLLSFIQEFGDTLNYRIRSVLPDLIDQAIPLDSAKLLAPIKYPRRNIFCVGKNYKDHALEVTQFTHEASPELPKYPIYFSKATNRLLADQEPIVVRKELARRLDYEVELAVIIGKAGCEIEPDQAAEYIFGYAIGNDISARDLQNERRQWFRGKSLDNSLPLGPWIVSRDAIAFPPLLNISAKINGELRQKSNTKEFIFDIPTLLADLSRGLTLFPGDIILTGTPAGVGVAMNPPQYLKDGDIIEFEIEGLGKLTNTVKLID